MKLEIADEHLNDHTRAGLNTLIERAARGYRTVARVHMTGEHMDEIYEADWLQHLTVTEPFDVGPEPPPTVMGLEDFETNA